MQSQKVPIETGNTKIGVLINEKKIFDVESKVVTVEQSNQFLAEQIRSVERNFEIQLKRMQQQYEVERDNRQKVERFVGMLTDQVKFLFKLNKDLNEHPRF